MSLSGGTAGGKGVDSNAVDTYDSGDEWDIGVGNLIIDLDADLEKDKLEMSGTKEGGGMAAPPSAVAALPDNIKFVSPVPAPQGKESKSKSKRSKNSKDNNKAPTGDGAKKESQSRPQAEAPGTPASAPAAAAAAAATGNSTTPSKGIEKAAKASRSVPNTKKDKDGTSAKSKKEKEVLGGPVAVVAIEREPAAPAQAHGGTRNASFENTQSAVDSTEAEEHGNNTLEPVGIVPPLAIKSEPEELDNSECRPLKKVKNEKVRRTLCFLEAVWWLFVLI